MHEVHHLALIIRKIFLCRKTKSPDVVSRLIFFSKQESISVRTSFARVRVRVSVMTPIIVRSVIGIRAIMRRHICTVVSVITSDVNIGRNGRGNSDNKRARND